MENSKQYNSGIVYLVGAGPGDPDLITLRGQKIISVADVIIYDFLANRKLLDYARADAELIYVGKQGSDHTLPQEEITALIIKKAREKKNVVRLKGGDPFVFGRGGEEALELARSGIRFEIIPGITSGIAAPAYAGIPVTHRDYASDFALITGHESADRTGPSQVDWLALGRWQGTLAFYMGVKNLPDICQNLINNGMDPDTPAAIIRWGTTSQQQTITGTITTLPELALAKQIRPPAIIVVGKVVQLREHLNWFEKRPLFGQRVVVTRSRTQASHLVDKLVTLGADTIEFPTIKIMPPDDSQPLLKAIASIERFDWIIFTSVNGVNSFFQYAHQMGKDSRILYRARICAIGPATAERLAQHGILPDLIPQKYVAESIFAEISHLDSLGGKAVLLPRSDIARSDLIDALASAGAEVEEVTAYRTVLDDAPREEVLSLIADNEIDWITFTSSSTVKNFFRQIPPQIIKNSKTKLASIGPITSQAIIDCNLGPDIEAAEYTIDGLVKAIAGVQQARPD